MKSKEDNFKGRKFTLSMRIGNQAIPYPGLVMESYGNLCLVQEQKASTTGTFHSYGIYTAGKANDGTDQLHALMINYQKDPNGPDLYGAPKAEVFAKYQDLVMAARLKESEDELKASQKARDDKAKAEFEKLRAENFQFIKSKQEELFELKGKLKGQKIEKLLADKKTREILLDSLIIEKLKTLLR